MTRRFVAAAVVALAAAVAVGANAGTAEPRGAGYTGPVIEVAVREWPVTVAAEGVVEAVRQTTLGAQVAGRIVALDVKAGDTVRAGQVLARIDARTAEQAVAASRSQVAEAQANLVNAKRKYERNRDLVAQKFVSQAALDQAEAEYKAAQAQLAAVTANEGQAIAAQSFTTIVAPYSGVIGETQAELGDMAQPGRPLITIFDPRELRVAATVSQASLAAIRLDAPVSIEIPAIDKTLVATGATVIPLADARSHTARVRLDLPAGEKLLPGQFARAYFTTGAARALAVPVSALLKRGEVTAVYVIDRGGRPQLRQVRVGESVGDRQVEILAGLSPGERVAANPVQAGMAPALAAADR
jgi:RND family efflux transporter MFP subunit